MKKNILLLLSTFITLNHAINAGQDYIPSEAQCLYGRITTLWAPAEKKAQNFLKETLCLTGVNQEVAHFLEKMHKRDAMSQTMSQKVWKKHRDKIGKKFFFFHQHVKQELLDKVLLYNQRHVLLKRLDEVSCDQAAQECIMSAIKPLAKKISDEIVISSSVAKLITIYSDIKIQSIDPKTQDIVRDQLSETYLLALRCCQQMQQMRESYDKSTQQAADLSPSDSDDEHEGPCSLM